MVCKICFQATLRLATVSSTLPLANGRRYPKWISDITISIAPNKKDAIREQEAASETLRVYSDGSAVGGGVGGAAVLMKGKKMIKERRFYLGGYEEHTTHEAELVGIILALQLLKEAGGQGTMALGEAFQSQPGHYVRVINILRNALKELLPIEDRRKLTVRWTPGHGGIAGNIAADVQAKKAARGEVSAGNMLPRSLRTRKNVPIKLPFSKSASL
ncbi:uncharacterized protein EDB93DRAFT_1159675 [Suillus bovinus]|uniref:uncharacterized protein n=1 Tax=Suillus bovinus TaxID=48563 RepID=UPI001B885BC2|nr:uncharacterized protein EDB93DRAFT_1159675 [Suillus bovinus]KAG2141406.1 hypothetical protein EDB93DRAFT_1159675 [Suillus bovinus]